MDDYDDDEIVDLSDIAEPYDDEYAARRIPAIDLIEEHKPPPPPTGQEEGWGELRNG